MERIPVEVDGHTVTAFSKGTGDDVILVVHGGPGVPCNYVRDAHLRYAEQGYRVVSWDQLGCGESDQPDDDSLWTVERYVEEMETVRSALGLGRVAVVGNSWGGMLGLEYCLAHPENVKCFVSSSIAYDFREVQQGFVRCKQNLGDETVLMMARRESEGTTEHPEYQAAQKILLYRHMCRDGDLAGAGSAVTRQCRLRPAPAHVRAAPLQLHRHAPLVRPCGRPASGDDAGAGRGQRARLSPAGALRGLVPVPAELGVRVLPRLRPHAVLGEPGGLPRRRRRVPGQVPLGSPPRLPSLRISPTGT